MSTATDADIARHGTCDMSAFAALSEDAVPDVFEKAAWELVGRPGAELVSATAELLTLAQRHATEWRDFRARFDEQGFLNRQREE